MDNQKFDAIMREPCFFFFLSIKLAKAKGRTKEVHPVKGDKHIRNTALQIRRKHRNSGAISIYHVQGYK